MFNPTFLVLLLILFFAGKFFGKLTKRLNIWKILLLTYFGLFFYGPVRDAGPILGGIFLLGMASNHTRLIFSIFGWAQNLGDVVYAFRYRKAFEDIRRREQESRAHEERKRAYAEYGRQSQQQRGWQDEAKQHRQKPDDAKTGRSGAGQNEKPRAKRKAGNGSQQQRTNQQQSRRQQPPAWNTARDRHLQALRLKLGREYTAAEIKKAYRKAVMKAHPDAGGLQVEFVAVADAWEWLRGKT